jgi:hypothetical protein
MCTPAGDKDSSSEAQGVLVIQVMMWYTVQAAHVKLHSAPGALVMLAPSSWQGCDSHQWCSGLPSVSRRTSVSRGGPPLTIYLQQGAASTRWGTHLHACSCVQEGEVASTLQHQLWLLLEVKDVGGVEVGGGVHMTVAGSAHHQVTKACMHATAATKHTSRCVCLASATQCCVTIMMCSCQHDCRMHGWTTS